MLSFNELEVLRDLVKEIHRSNSIANSHAFFLEKIKARFSENRHGQEGSERFTDSEVERLMKLNRSLGEIETLVQETAHELWPELVDKIKNPNSPMGDFEFETQIDFMLRDDDPEASDDSDNIMTTRKVFVSQPDRKTIDKELIDFRESGNGETNQLATEPHCHLFHDLYEHSYGVEQPSVPLRDCLRIGSVWVEVIVRQQYFLDLETGKWNKDCGSRHIVANNAKEKSC